MLSTTKQATSRRRRRAAGYKEYMVELSPEHAQTLREQAYKSNTSRTRYIAHVVTKALEDGYTIKAS
jgi:hypothetical protein